MGKVYCETCKKRCRGNVLRAGEKYFHKDCFRCADCNSNLEGRGYFTKNDKFYCEKDYQNLTYPKCKVCSRNLDGDIVSALTYSFHKGCFICSNCKTPFHPGNRVTVWKDHFFCIVCSKSLNTSVPFVTDTSNLSANLSVNSDRSNGGVAKYRLSFADKMDVLPSIEVDQENSHCFSQDVFRKQPSSTTISKANGEPPKILKSSLRRSTALEQKMQSPQEYTSTDYSEQGDGLFSNHNGASTLPTSTSTDQADLINQSFSPRSRTFNPDQSINYSGRHPLSEFGRFYNQSYMSMAEQSVRRSTDQYRRSGTITPATSGSLSKLQHFHVPEGNFRYSLPPNYLRSSNVSRYARSFHSSLRDALDHEPVIRKAPAVTGSHQHYQQSSQDFMYSSPQLAPSSDESHISPQNRMELNASCSSQTLEANLEARRLASFPGGHPKDSNAPAAIERYDWPAPASTAVVLAEIMRERRHARRAEARLSGSCRDGVDGDDVDSQENLSIDASIDSPPSDQASSISGIGRAILLEEEEQKRRKSRSHRRMVDPVSASRTPNANAEPPFKTRYLTHSFASPSRESSRASCSPHRLGYSLDFVNLGNRVWTVGGSGVFERLHSPRNKMTLRPGYTAGQLTMPFSKTTSLPGANCFSYPRLNGGPNATIYEESQSPLINENGHQNGHGSVMSHLSPTLTNGRVNEGGYATKNEFKYSKERSPGHARVLYSSYPSTALKTVTSPPLKEIPYQELVSRTNSMLKCLDSTKLEMYLSDAEFEEVFQLTRSAFYRLPEWKRNDLKRRLNLF